MTVSRPRLLAATLAGGAAALLATAGPAAAGSRAHLDITRAEEHVGVSSSSGATTVSATCPAGSHVLDGSLSVRDVDRGSATDVSSVLQGAGQVGGEYRRWSYTVTVAEGSESADDFADAEDEDLERSAKIKVFATCLGDETSAGDATSVSYASVTSPVIGANATKGSKRRKLNLRTVTGITSTDTIAPGGQAVIKVACPTGFQAVQGSSRLDVGGAAEDLRYQVGEEPRGDAWALRVRNPITDALRPLTDWESASVTCLAEKTGKQRKV